jgi:hypothetical protein
VNDEEEARFAEDAKKLISLLPDQLRPWANEWLASQSTLADTPMIVEGECP